MGFVVTWVTWVRGFRGSMGAWVVWVKLLRGLCGSNMFAWVQFFFSWFFVSVKTFYVGPKCLRGSIFSLELVIFYLLDDIILLYYN